MAVSTILSGCGSSTGTSVQSEVAQENNEEEAVSTEVAEENPVDDQIRENFLEIKNNVSPMILDIVNGDGSQYDKAAFEQALVDIESAQMLVDVMLSDSDFKKALDTYYKLLKTDVTVCLNLSELSEVMKSLGTDLSEAGTAYATDANALYNAIQNIYDKYTSEYQAPQEYQVSFEGFNAALLKYRDLLYKQYKAQEKNDWVRYYTAKKFEDRINNQMNGCMNALTNDANYMKQVMKNLYDLSSRLESEIDGSFEDMANYSLPAFDNDIVIDTEYPEVIYPQQYSTYDSILILRGYSILEPIDVLVEVEIPGFTQKYSQTVTLDENCTKLYVKPPILTEEADLSQAKDAQLTINITNMSDNSLIKADTNPIKLKSRNDFEFYGEEFYLCDKYNILCMLEPESDAIVELKRLAVEWINVISNGAINSLPGYQKVTDWNEIQITSCQVAAIQAAMSSMGVKYVMDPYSVSGSSQSINLPSETLEKKSGLCVETSLVMASALQSLGMHPLLVFPPGHCQVAVESWKDSGQYLLIETTHLPYDGNGQVGIVDIRTHPEYFNLPTNAGVVNVLSQEQWNAYLQNCDIIDCWDARLLGLTALAN